MGHRAKRTAVKTHTIVMDGRLPMNHKGDREGRSRSEEIEMQLVIQQGKNDLACRIFGQVSLVDMGRSYEE